MNHYILIQNTTKVAIALFSQYAQYSPNHATAGRSIKVQEESSYSNLMKFPYAATLELLTTK